MYDVACMIRGGMSMKKTKHIYTIILLILVASIFSSCKEQTEEEQLVVVESKDETISYKFATVLKGDVQKTQKIKCTYKQTDAEEVIIPVSGKLIDKVYVKEGDVVNKGDLLCELSAGSLEEQIATLEYSIARNELLLGYLDINEDYDISEKWLYGFGTEAIMNSVDSLKKNNRYKREDYNDALEFDRKELAQLKADFRNSKIYAKSSGTVYKLKENLQGSTSLKDTVIMTIVDSSECLFLAEDISYANYFEEGKLYIMNISTGSAAGEYELAPFDIANWGDMMLFSIESGPDGYSLDVGAYGTVKIVLEEKKDCLYLPITSVHTADDESYVYVLDENNMRQVRFIETGLYGDDNVEIVSGLAEGDKVVRR